MISQNIGVNICLLNPWYRSKFESNVCLHARHRKAKHLKSKASRSQLWNSLVCSFFLRCRYIASLKFPLARRLSVCVFIGARKIMAAGFYDIITRHLRMKLWRRLVLWKRLNNSQMWIYHRLPGLNRCRQVHHLFIF